MLGENIYYGQFKQVIDISPGLNTAAAIVHLYFPDMHHHAHSLEHYDGVVTSNKWTKL